MCDSDGYDGFTWKGDGFSSCPKLKTHRFINNLGSNRKMDDVCIHKIKKNCPKYTETSACSKNRVRSPNSYEFWTSEQIHGGFHQWGYPHIWMFYHVLSWKIPHVRWLRGTPWPRLPWDPSTWATHLHPRESVLKAGTWGICWALLMMVFCPPLNLTWSEIHTLKNCQTCWNWTRTGSWNAKTKPQKIPLAPFRALTVLSVALTTRCIAWREGPVYHCLGNNAIPTSRGFDEPL